MEIRDLFELENYEIRHSNILAWLLNLKENHHLVWKVNMVTVF